MSMSIEQKLSLNKFNVDEGNPHIIIHEDKLDKETIQTLTKGCPAGLYTLNEKGQLVFEVAGCLECGTCRVICAHKAGGMEWNHPEASFGVLYRFG